MKKSISQGVQWFYQDGNQAALRARQMIRLVIVVVLIGVLFWLIPIGQVMAVISTAKPAVLLLGMFLILPNVFFTALELKVLLEKQGIRHSVWKILSINLATKFYNLVTPGTVIGSGVRWYRLAQPGGKVVESLAALAFFRLLETFLTIVFGSAFWLVSGRNTFMLRTGWLIGLFLGTIFFWLFLTRASIFLLSWIRNRLNRPDVRLITKKILLQGEGLFKAVAAYADSSARILFFAFIYGLSSMLIGVLSSMFLAKAVGIELTFMEMGWINALVMLLTQLPFTVAGGLGVREASLVAILPAFGIEAERALAFSLLLFVRGFLLSLMGGINEALGTFRIKHTK